MSEETKKDELQQEAAGVPTPEEFAARNEARRDAAPGKDFVEVNVEDKSKNGTRNALILALFMLLAMAMGGFAIRSFLNDRDAMMANPNQKSITIYIEHKTGTKDTSKYELITDCEYLGGIITSGRLGVVDQREYGMFIVSMENDQANEKKGEYWMYYVNGEYGQTGVEQCPIHDGDEFLFRIETFEAGESY